jgi:hypothetical protein
MSETFVQVATNGSGEKIAVSQLSNGVDNVDAQHIIIQDDTTYAARAKVNNAEPATSDYGLSVRRVCAGATISKVVSAASTNAANIKASAGRITGWVLANLATDWRFVKFHNTAGTPTAGSGVVYPIAIPPGQQVVFDDDDGIAFATGIGITIVLGAEDANALAVGLNDVIGAIHFK